MLNASQSDKRGLAQPNIRGVVSFAGSRGGGGETDLREFPADSMFPAPKLARND